MAGTSPISADVIFSCDAGSFVDTNLAAYHHHAQDYRVDRSLSGCVSCGAAFSSSNSQLQNFSLKRIHRYRDQSAISSFGPGVFSNWDVVIYLFEDGDDKFIDVFDPKVNMPQRYVDTAPIDGAYEDAVSNKAKSLSLFDAAGVLTNDQSNAASAELITHEGFKFEFEIFEQNGSRVGRWVKFTDRNDYECSLEYAFPVDDPFDRQFQIQTITDPHNRVATFAYSKKQQSGRWVVREITFPNNEKATYQYTDGFLSQVKHPDGTASTITKAFNATAQATTFAIFDASADATKRAKTIYLQDVVAMPDLGSGEIVTQSAGLVRIVLNGSDEVTFISFPGATSNSMWLYEGWGRLKKMRNGNITDVQYFDQWTLTTMEGGGVNVTGQAEPTFSKYDWDNPQTQATPNFFKTEPKKIRDASNRFKEYQYNDQNAISEVEHNDGTNEFFEYNEFRQRTLYVDRLNRAMTMTYDARGNMTSRTIGLIRPDGGMITPTKAIATWRWEYFPEGHPNQFLMSKSIDANGNETDYEYNEDHFLVKITEPPDNQGDRRAKNFFEYDFAGRLIKTTDPLGREVELTYDSRSRTVEIEYFDDSTETFMYGSGVEANLVVQRTDRNGNISDMEYDSQGRLIQQIEAFDTPVAIETTYSYLDGTNLVREVVRKGERTTKEFDYRQRWIKETVQPQVGKELVRTRTFLKNLLNNTSDFYGRRTFFAYDGVDQYLIRTVQEMTPDVFGSFESNRHLLALSRGDQSITNRTFIITDFDKDSENQNLKTTDGRNIEHTNSYDQQIPGRMTSKVVAASDPTVSGRWEYDYDPQGNTIEVRRPRHFDDTENGRFKDTMTYTGRNLLKTQTEAAGRREKATMSYTYNLDQTTNVMTDYRGNNWQTLWENCCRRTQGSVDPEGSGTVSNPDFYGNTTHTAVVSDRLAVADPHDPIGVLNEITTKFDSRHRPIARTVWLVDLGKVDPNDVPIAGDDGIPATDGLTSRWEYDDDLSDGVGIDDEFASQLTPLSFGDGSDGYAVKILNPEDEHSIAIYDGLGRTVMTIDGLGDEDRIEYDSLVKLKAFDGKSVTSELLQTSQVDPLGHITTMRSDGGGRTLQTLDEEKQATQYEYDNNSNRVVVSDPNQVGVDCVYDQRDREESCLDTAGDSTGRAYDRENNVVRYLDGFNNATSCTFDGRNRKLTCVSRVGGITSYTYDGNNNVKTITDGDNATTTYVYEKRNLKTEEIFDGHVDSPPDAYDKIIYGYDGARRLETRDDQNRDIMVFVYDNANRLLRRKYPDNKNDVFTYDRASRLLTASSQRYENTITRVYDDDSRAVSENLLAFGQNFFSQYDYDADDRRSQITYPSGAVINRAYTARDQLAQIYLDSVFVDSRIYDPGTRLTTCNKGNGLTETRTYFNDNLVHTIRVPGGITDFTYDYDANKRRISEANGVRPEFSQTHGYDAEDRTTKWNLANGDNQGWLLSLVGDWDTFSDNGVPEVRTHNGVHELEIQDGDALQYDPKGNLTQVDDNQFGQQSLFAWDFDNQLQQAHVMPNDPVMFSYDALGRRVSKEIQNNVTVFVCDGAQVIEEFTGVKNETKLLARKYVYATYIDDVCLLVRASDDAKFFYHRDAIFNTREITNRSGALVEGANYTPYGDTTIHDGNRQTQQGSVVTNPYWFQGRRFDENVRLYYYRARYSDVNLGRFIGRDPIGHWQDISNKGNPYGFVGSDPIRYLDPFGLQAGDLVGELFPSLGRLAARASFWFQIVQMKGDLKIADARFQNELVWKERTKLGKYTIEVDSYRFVRNRKSPSVIVHYPVGYCCQWEEWEAWRFSREKKVDVHHREGGTRIDTWHGIVWIDINFKYNKRAEAKGRLEQILSDHPDISIGDFIKKINEGGAAKASLGFDKHVTRKIKSRIEGGTTTKIVEGTWKVIEKNIRGYTKILKSWKTNEYCDDNRLERFRNGNPKGPQARPN